MWPHTSEAIEVMPWSRTSVFEQLTSEIGQVVRETQNCRRWIIWVNLEKQNPPWSHKHILSGGEDNVRPMLDCHQQQQQQEELTWSLLDDLFMSSSTRRLVGILFCCQTYPHISRRRPHRSWRRPPRINIHCVSDSSTTSPLSEARPLNSKVVFGLGWRDLVLAGRKPRGT